MDRPKETRSPLAALDGLPDKRPRPRRRHGSASPRHRPRPGTTRMSGSRARLPGAAVSGFRDRARQFLTYPSVPAATRQYAATHASSPEYPRPSLHSAIVAPRSGNRESFDCQAMRVWPVSGCVVATETRPVPRGAPRPTHMVAGGPDGPSGKRRRAVIDRWGTEY